MLLKTLGIIDLIIGLIILLMVFGTKIPTSIMVVCIIILAIKGSFIITKDIASAQDILVVFVLVLNLIFAMPKIILLVAAFLMFQKGFVSLL